MQGTTEEHLAFYYFHKDAMQEILTEVKRTDLKKRYSLKGQGV